MKSSDKLIKGIIFDLDGTLIDSDKDIEKIVNFIRKNNLNKKKININRIASYTSIGGDLLIKQLISNKDQKIYLKIFRKLYQKLKIRKKLIIPSLIDLLKFIKSKKIKIYICTNKPYILTKKIINKTPLKKFVTKYFCSDKYKLKKPNKKFFTIILNKIKLRKHQIIYIGDSMVDYNFCKNSDISFFLFKNKRVTYPKKIYLNMLKANRVFSDYKKISNLKKAIIN